MPIRSSLACTVKASLMGMIPWLDVIKSGKVTSWELNQEGRANCSGAGCYQQQPRAFAKGLSEVGSKNHAAGLGSCERVGQHEAGEERHPIT